jgi:hypothetical protein
MKFTKSLIGVSMATTMTACGGGAAGGSDGGLPTETAYKAPDTCATFDAGASYRCDAMTGFNGDESLSPVTVGNIKIESIEVAQLNLKQPDSNYFILTAGRDTLLRVVALGDRAAMKAPNLRLTITNIDTGIESLNTVLAPKSAKRVLPQTGNAADAAMGNPTLPDMYRSYLYVLPANLMPAANLEVKAEIDTSGLTDSIAVDNSKIALIKPVSVPTLKIVNVPIAAGGDIGTIPDDASIKNAALRFLPISSVEIRDRATYFVDDAVLGGYTVMNYPNGVFNAKNRINWDQQGKFSLLPGVDGSSDELYVGWIKGNAGGLWANFSDTILVGDKGLYDQNFAQSDSAQAIFGQEIYNDWHVADVEKCGSLAQDPSYPYPDAGLNGVWGIEMSANHNITLKSPNKHSSITSYCELRHPADYQVNLFINNYKGY